jgi:hypothetical protein
VILSVIFYTLNSVFFATMLNHFFYCYSAQPFYDFYYSYSVTLWSCQNFFVHWTQPFVCYSVQHFLLIQCSVIFLPFLRSCQSFFYSVQPFSKINCLVGTELWDQPRGSIGSTHGTEPRGTEPCRHGGRSRGRRWSRGVAQGAPGSIGWV